MVSLLGSREPLEIVKNLANAASNPKNPDRWREQTQGKTIDQIISSIFPITDKPLSQEAQSTLTEYLRTLEKNLTKNSKEFSPTSPKEVDPNKLLRVVSTALEYLENHQSVFTGDLQKVLQSPEKPIKEAVKKKEPSSYNIIKINSCFSDLEDFCLKPSRKIPDDLKKKLVGLRESLEEGGEAKRLLGEVMAHIEIGAVTRQNDISDKAITALNTLKQAKKLLETEAKQSQEEEGKEEASSDNVIKINDCISTLTIFKDYPSRTIPDDLKKKLVGLRESLEEGGEAKRLLGVTLNNLKNIERGEATSSTDISNRAAGAIEALNQAKTLLVQANAKQ